MPQGQHREGYRKPGKGQSRRTRQPFAVEKLPEPKRSEVLELLRAAKASRCACPAKKGHHWHPFAELPGVVQRVIGLELSIKQIYGAYDVLVAQADAQVHAQAARSKAVAQIFQEHGYENLPQTSLNALAAQVFEIAEAGSQEERLEATSSLVLMLSKMTAAQASAAKVELEKEKIALSRERLEQMRAKLTGLKQDVAGDGKKKISNQELQKKLDEIYDLVQPSAA